MANWHLYFGGSWNLTIPCSYKVYGIRLDKTFGRVTIFDTNQYETNAECFTFYLTPNQWESLENSTEKHLIVPVLPMQFGCAATLTCIANHVDVSNNSIMFNFQPSPQSAEFALMVCREYMK